MIILKIIRGKIFKNKMRFRFKMLSVAFFAFVLMVGSVRSVAAAFGMLQFWSKSLLRVF